MVRQPPPLETASRRQRDCPTISLLLHLSNSYAPFIIAIMSFDQLSSLESQSTTTRRQDDPQYTDDPEFQKLSQDLMAKLFNLTGNISRLSNEVALLGTKRDTERLRERVHDILEETKDTFKDVGEGVKKLQSWEDVSVSCNSSEPLWPFTKTYISRRKNTPSRRSPKNSKTTSRPSKVFSAKPLRNNDPQHQLHVTH